MTKFIAGFKNAVGAIYWVHPNGMASFEPKQFNSYDEAKLAADKLATNYPLWAESFVQTIEIN